MKDRLNKLAHDRFVLVVWIALKLALIIQFARDTVAVIYQGF